MFGCKHGGGSSGGDGDDCRAISTSFGFVLLATTNLYIGVSFISMTSQSKEVSGLPQVLRGPLPPG